jgi:hypothetical protein
MNKLDPEDVAAVDKHSAEAIEAIQDGEPARQVVRDLVRKPQDAAMRKWLEDKIPVPEGAKISSGQFVMGVDEAIGKDRTVEATIKASADPNEQPIVTINPDLANPYHWIRAGADAKWVGRFGVARTQVKVLGWREGGKRVVVRVLEGRDTGNVRNVPPDRLVSTLPVAPVAPGSSAGQSTITTGKDPAEVTPANVERVVVKVAGKLRYNGPVTPAAGELLTMLAAHGRRMVVTLHMRDGTKQRYRGNGARLV